MSDRLLDRATRGPVLLDAAMGTRLIARGLDLAADDPCLWNLSRPDVVLDVHRRDVAAGAEAVFANTFGANRAWLGRFARTGSVVAVNRAAVALAREAAGPGRFVVGSIGPTAAGDPATLREQADALLDAGADALALETFRLDPALAALPALAPAPILVGLFDWPGPIEDAARRLVDAGASAVGANCFADFDLARRLLDACHAAGIPAWLKPSPGRDGPGFETFEHLAARVAATGSGLLGGCCGTTEDHVATIRRAWGRSGEFSAICWPGVRR